MIFDEFILQHVAIHTSEIPCQVLRVFKTWN